jgi:hypothetical protein
MQGLPVMDNKTMANTERRTTIVIQIKSEMVGVLTNAPLL